MSCAVEEEGPVKCSPCLGKREDQGDWVSRDRVGVVQARFRSLIILAGTEIPPHTVPDWKPKMDLSPGERKAFVKSIEDSSLLFTILFAR